MNRQEREALCGQADYFLRGDREPTVEIPTPLLETLTAEIRRLADELEWIKDYESRWPQSLEVSDIKERARRALDGEDK